MDVLQTPQAQLDGELPVLELNPDSLQRLWLSMEEQVIDFEQSGGEGSSLPGAVKLELPPIDEDGRGIPLIFHPEYRAENSGVVGYLTDEYGDTEVLHLWLTKDGEVAYEIFAKQSETDEEEIEDIGKLDIEKFNEIWDEMSAISLARDSDQLPKCVKTVVTIDGVATIIIFQPTGKLEHSIVGEVIDKSHPENNRMIALRLDYHADEVIAENLPPSEESVA